MKFLPFVLFIFVAILSVQLGDDLTNMMAEDPPFEKGDRVWHEGDDRFGVIESMMWVQVDGEWRFKVDWEDHEVWRATPRGVRKKFVRESVVNGSELEIAEENDTEEDFDNDKDK